MNDSIKIGYETDSAIIYFGLNDIIQKNKNLLDSKEFDDRWDHQVIDQFKMNLEFLYEVQDDLVVQHWANKDKFKDQRLYDLSGFIDQWVFKGLMFDGKAEVWNKSSNNFESKIKYHYVKDRLGGENAFYTFADGKEFHNQIIALGE